MLNEALNPESISINHDRLFQGIFKVLVNSILLLLFLSEAHHVY